MDEDFFEKGKGQNQPLQGLAMWLWYDWRAAAVADEHGNIVDAMEWDGHMTEHAVVERLRLIAAGQPVREATELKERFPEAVVCAVSYTHLTLPTICSV